MPPLRCSQCTTTVPTRNLAGGSLYAWAGSMSATLAAAPVGAAGEAVYANPGLFANPPAAYNTVVYNAERMLALCMPSFPANGKRYVARGNVIPW